MTVVTIQRGTKSGGQALAENLAEELGYPILGREVLQSAAAQLGVPPEDVGEKMEEGPPRFGRRPVITNLYVAAVTAALAERAAEGNLIYHGLAGGFLLSGLPGVLRVRLIAPLDLRVQALMISHGMGEADAEAYIRSVDDGRARWVKNVYGQSNTDSSRYDMVLNLGGLSTTEACEIVITAARRPEFEMTPTRLAFLQDFHVASQIRLALMEDLGTQTLDLDVSFSDGAATVRGEARLFETGEVEDRIKEIASAVPGVSEVQIAIEWFDPYP
jgi:cytidylate kinase